MGYGDQLIATGLARGAADRGKRVAFGNGKKIIWDHHSEEIFRGNPNIAPPGSEGARDLEWIGYYKGRRGYNRHDVPGNRWVWNMNWCCRSGEMYFTKEERHFTIQHGSGFIVIEPNVESWKSVAPNKDWGRARYQAVASRLKLSGYRVVQFRHDRGGLGLAGVEQIKTASFREALAIMANAALYIGPEGGLHHGAAAVGIPAVVIFGGFIPPQVTGYDTHTNLTGGATACGSLSACPHCRAALEAITVDDVYTAALRRVKRAA